MNPGENMLKFAVKKYKYKMLLFQSCCFFNYFVCSDYTQYRKFLLYFTVSNGYHSLKWTALKRFFYENRASVLENVLHYASLAAMENFLTFINY